MIGTAAQQGASAAPRRIGVFGGSFDPIHIGHLVIAEELRHALRLDLVLFLPAGRPPHKPSHQLAADADRIAMIERSIAGTPGFAVSRIDIDRGGYSYTVESLPRVHAAYPDVDEMYFLMGEDSLRDFPTWRSPGEIAALARLGVAQRPGVEVDIAAIERAVPQTRGRIELVEVPLIGVSSRDIRARAQAGLPIRFQVLPAVADYIAERGLYQSHKSGG